MSDRRIENIEQFYIVEEDISTEGSYISTWGGDGGGVYNDYAVAVQALYATDSSENKILYAACFENGKLKPTEALDAVRYQGGPSFSYARDVQMLQWHKQQLERG